MASLRSLALLGMLALAPNTVAGQNPCIVMGIDFQDGGYYFQNSLSDSPFTFVQEFEGCQSDNSSNLIVNPNGEQLQCSDTPLQPSDTPELSTCPINKNQLISGPWSIVVLSNNGNGDPIAYQRDFNLTVGPQQTTTITPTITIVASTTPVVNATSTTTDFTSTTLPAKTTTVPSTTIHPTKTVTPQKVTTYTTQTLFTVTRVIPTVTVIKTTQTITPSCAVPAKPTHPDKTCSIVPTLAGLPEEALDVVASAVPLPLGRYRSREADLFNDKAKFIAERDAYLASAGNIMKRAPDQPVVTITDPNTSKYQTITSTSTFPTSTATTVTTVLVTSTITPPAVIVYRGQAIEPTTVTAPTPTRTITRFTVARTTISKTVSYTVTIKTTAKPAASVTACRRRGGHYW